VDPTLLRALLNSADVLEVYSFDPKKAPKVQVVSKQPVDFLDERSCRACRRPRRGVGVFLPRAPASRARRRTCRRSWPRINAAYYHGGEPIRVIRPVPRGRRAEAVLPGHDGGGAERAQRAGTRHRRHRRHRFANVVERGRNVLTKLHLGNNEILQMAGRVHGRVEGGRVFILSDRDIDFAQLRPTEPDFQLAGDSERVALTAAALGVRADMLDLPVPLDGTSYRRALRCCRRAGSWTTRAGCRSTAVRSRRCRWSAPGRS
jgi:hypothetical protein